MLFLPSQFILLEAVASIAASFSAFFLLIYIVYFEVSLCILHMLLKKGML